MIQAGVWKHHKGGLYQVLGIAAHAETDERMVVYVSLTGANLPGPRMRVRVLHEWQEAVGVWPDGSIKPRYWYLGPEIPADESNRPGLCTRLRGHSGPCNGCPRPECGTRQPQGKQ